VLLPAAARLRIDDAVLEINGFRRNKGGGYAIANNFGIWLWDGPGSEPRLIASETGGASAA
jgi:hypothetical protein